MFVSHSLLAHDNITYPSEMNCTIRLVAADNGHREERLCMDRDRIVTNISSTPQVDTQQQLREQHELIQAIQFLNRSNLPMLGGNSRFQYQIDAATRIPVVKVIQADTKDVIYQLPPEYVIELARQERRKKREAALGDGCK